MILTGLPVTAQEMEQRGVVNKVVLPDQDVLEESLKTARLIAARSAPALRLAKHAVKTGEFHFVNQLKAFWLTVTSRDYCLERGVGN
jgi:enoyl-CoA hydratase